ncbi:enolase C-terminal domain-like protein [Teredinibacter purpureus]|uniref:enolase C-terminal domain-like protein n=1 Tax=Teredinibacter purpureus TaxID=2731756 RepID=UPI0005F81331|nr:enolase C-terminal domain-like protein [Teredinibacter purpureus]
MESPIESLMLYRAVLPYKAPLHLASGIAFSREVILLEWTVNGEKFWSEIAPLPGFSQESLTQCLVQLRTFFSKSNYHTLSALHEFSRGDTCYPSVALGCSVESFQSHSSLQSSPRPPSNVCTLLTYENHCGKGEALVSDEGLKDSAVVKMKVGMLPLKEDIARIDRICNLTSFKGSIRLDANQQWSLADIEWLSKNIDTARIQWIEEPLTVAQEYREWGTVTDLRFAYDESLYRSEQPPVFYTGLTALVLKPMLLGPHRVKALCGWAALHQCETVLSSSFESIVGMAYLYQLAENWPCSQYHGFDTLKYFTDAYSARSHMRFVTPIERLIPHA